MCWLMVRGEINYKMLMESKIDVCFCHCAHLVTSARVTVAYYRRHSRLHSCTFSCLVMLLYVCIKFLYHFLPIPNISLSIKFLSMSVSFSSTRPLNRALYSTQSDFLSCSSPLQIEPRALDTSLLSLYCIHSAIVSSY